MRIIEAAELDAVCAGEVPQHIGCIMDGNGRWALMRSKSRSDGHAAAEDSVVSVVDGCLRLGVQWLTVYAFSTENWSREPAEVTFLMSFEEWLLRKERRDEMIEKGVRIRFLGRLDDERIPARSLEWLLETVELTKHNRQLNFCIAFNYGGRAELVEPARKLITQGVAPEDVTEESFARELYLPDLPEMDLVVRTSAEERMSNFFPWHSTYAELVFTDTLWPDFHEWHLYSAVSEYQSRRRRMGAALAPVVPS